MFERYTESARRALFFSRYEASELGRRSIETEHLLLGLLRAGKGVTSRIPFSDETNRILDHTAEEADRLRHSSIGTEHLFAKRRS